MSMNEHLNDKYHRENQGCLMIEIKIVLFWKEREDCYLDGEIDQTLSGCQAKFYF